MEFQASRKFYPPCQHYQVLLVGWGDLPQCKRYAKSLLDRATTAADS